jgi:hypothetical protein
MLPHEEFHEVWWIFSKNEDYGGLRVAHFRKSVHGVMLIIISNEQRNRMGARIWDDIRDREGWVRVKQIEVPTKVDVTAAIDARLYEIGREVTAEVFGDRSQDDRSS